MDKLTEKHKRAEYDLWQKKYPALRFISKSRLGKIFGPMFVGIEFTPGVGKYTYYPGIFVYLFSSSSNYIFSDKFLNLQSPNIPLEFCYYPFNENFEWIESEYLRYQLPPPLNQKDKIESIDKSTYLKISFAGDLNVSEFLNQLNAFKINGRSRPDFEYENDLIIIQLYIELYLGNNDAVQYLYLKLKSNFENSNQESASIIVNVEKDMVNVDEFRERTDLIVRNDKRFKEVEVGLLAL